MRKKIAIMTTKLYGGGAERVASNLSLYLSEQKYDKHLILFDAENIEYPYGGQLIDLKTSVLKNPIGKLFNILKRVYYVRKFKRNNDIDTTISLLSGPNLINILARKNDKIIVSVRNFVSKSSKGFYGKMHNIIIKKIYNNADVIIAVSYAIKKDLVENYGLKENKVRVINNPYDIEKIRKLSSEELESDYNEIFDKPTIITAGRISEQKGHWHLLRAFKKVKQSIPDAQLVIMGKGSLEKYIRNLAKDLDIDKDVHLTGFQNNPFKFISKSKVYVFPSLYEGFPNALCEAMACKVPVISSDCMSGPREILAPKTNYKINLDNIEFAEYGILVPVCDGVMYKANENLTSEEEILAASIVRVLSDEGIRSKYAERSVIRIEDFQTDKIIKAWEEIL